MKLQRQIVLLVIAALLPLVALSAVLGAAALRQGQKDMRRDAELSVSAIAAGVNRELDSQIDALQAIAASPVFDGTVDRAQFEVVAGRLMHDHPMWMDVTLSDPSGTRLLDSPPLPVGLSNHVIDRISHAEAVRTARPVIGRVMRSPRGNVAFAVFVPVIRSGKVVAILGAVVRPAALHGFLQTIGLPAKWRAGVMDASHRVVTRTLAPDLATRLATQPALDALAAAPEGVYRGLGSDNLPLIVVYKVLPESGWSIHVAMPRAAYEAPFLRAAGLVGVGAAVSLVLVGLFLSLLAREVSLRQRESASREEASRMEALGRMTGGVAHDFNNLLMIVQGSADLLRRRSPQDGRAATLVDAILSAAQRGQGLTRQLLAFGRRSTHEPVNFRLQDRSADLRELLQRSVHAEVTVRLELSPETWPIHADPSALEVALINLAVNAGDAMPEGGTLSITASNAVLQVGRDDGAGLVGDFVVLSVSDTGLGIPPEHVTHVFEPFYTTKPTGKGTGLGLSQVYGFAKQSRGTATVKSKPGQGATFTLYLPRGGEAPAPAEPEADTAGQEEGRVLLVEDNEQVGAIASVMLEQAGYTVLWSRDGRAALEAMDQAGPFDIVLSDVALGPPMSGAELAVQLRQRQPELPVVLMTGYGEGLASVAHGAFPVLAKPFDQREMTAALRRARKRRPGIRAAAMQPTD